MTVIINDVLEQEEKTYKISTDIPELHKMWEKELKKLKKEKTMKKKKQKLSGSEAIFGFCAWLNSRDEQTVMGGTSKASPMFSLIKEFCEVNKLSDPRPNWTKALTHPPKGDKNG